MTQYRPDLEDIFFNLFKVVKCQERHNDLDETDLKQIVNEYSKFCANEMFPVRMLTDEEGVKLLEGNQVKVAPSLHKINQGYYDNGWFALGQKEELGGIEVPHSVYTGCMSLAIGSNASYMMYPGLSRAAFNLLADLGPKDSRELCLSKLVSGEWGGTMCLTEAGAGSDVGALTTKATKLDNGRYSITGEKIFISSGDNDLYENMLHLVLARTQPDRKGTKGISLFLVPKIRFDEKGELLQSNGVVCEKVEEKMGLHASATCALVFGSNTECEGILVGEEFDGMKNMFYMMNEARLITALQGESQGTFAFMLALEYAKERVQFDKTIIQHPDVRRALLKMRSMGRGLRALCLYVADLFDQIETDPLANNLISLLTPICKSYCTDEGFQTTVEGLQIFGGYGYCKEYGIEQYVRDAKIASIYEGTNGIQAIDFVTRKIMKDGGKTLNGLMEKIKATLGHEQSVTWKEEQAMFIEQLTTVETVMKRLVELAGQGKTNLILEQCTDLLNVFGHIVTGWRVLENAIIAQNELNNGEIAAERREFLESKVQDYQSFCKYHLVRNFGILRSLCYNRLNLDGAVL